MLTQMDCFGLTDMGCRRTSNQEHYLIADLNKSLRVHRTSLNIDNETRLYGGSEGKLLLVADGMGGAAKGERASAIAVEHLVTYVLSSLSWCYRLEEHSEHDFEEHLKEALRSCQDSIKAAVDQRPEAQGMGTTMTMVYIVWPRAFVVHVGDSRCYLFRGDRLEQVTIDHTVGDLLAGVAIDVYKLLLDRSDLLLLCTDGLYDMVPEEKLRKLLSSRPRAEADRSARSEAKPFTNYQISPLQSSEIDSPHDRRRRLYAPPGGPGAAHAHGGAHQHSRRRQKEVRILPLAGELDGDD